MAETPITIDRRSAPIPTELPSVAGWKEIPILTNAESEAEPVPLGPFSDYPTIFTDSIYGGERDDSPYQKRDYDLRNPVHLEGSLITMFVRPSVAEMLVTAQSLLPPNNYLIIHDAYRTIEVQKTLYNHYYSKLKEKHSDWGESQLAEETQKYVSLPSADNQKPSPHNTGGAVDVAIIKVEEKQGRRIREIEKQIASLPKDHLKRYKLEMEMLAIKAHGMYLNFGTPFDHGSRKASLNYFEHLSKERILSADEKEALENRRLLYNVMTEAGFQPYPDEWWHYNSPKSQMGAKTKGIDHAEYGAMLLSNENILHEQMRKRHKLGVERIAAGWKRPSYRKTLTQRIFRKNPDPVSEEFKVVKKAVDTHGKFSKTTLPNAEEIAP
jgi:zinc D-Ala-D-Ala dipeptidase